MSIPKIIWQTYKTKFEDMPIEAKNAAESWKIKNPEYEYRYMDDYEAADFVLEEYGQEMFDLFINCPIGVMRADMWRYLVIYRYGGVYSDIDTFCNHPIREWLSDDYNTLISTENNFHFCQWTFASVPNSPMLKCVIDLMVERLKNIDTSYEHFVVHTTGPGVWTDGILQYLQMPNELKLHSVANSYNGTKVAQRDRVIIDSNDIFLRDKVVHYFGSVSWKNTQYERWREGKKTILLYSIVRNIENTVYRLYDQIFEIVDSHPEYNFLLSIYENDSTDNTKDILKKLDWSFVENSIVMENIGRPYFGSHPFEERVKNLAEARNKAIEAKDFLSRSDYVLMIEGDMRFEDDVFDKILNFPNIEPNFSIVSATTFLDENDNLWDSWATRKNEFENRGSLHINWKLTEYDRYYSTSNGACLYLAEPFKRGVRYGYFNKKLNTWDCEMVVVCENFHELGYNNIYIIHNAKAYCFG